MKNLHIDARDLEHLQADERIDIICDAFESDWKSSGRPPRIDDYLKLSDESAAEELDNVGRLSAFGRQDDRAQ